MSTTFGSVDAWRLWQNCVLAIRSRHCSRRTEEAYVYWIRKYILFHGKRHPNQLDASAVTAFLGWLAVGRSGSASTQNQALSALVFLYKEVLRAELGAIEPMKSGVCGVNWRMRPG